MTDFSGPVGPDQSDPDARPPIVPVIPMAPGPAGIVPPAAGLAAGLHDDPTPVRWAQEPEPDAGQWSDSPPKANTEPAGALDRLVESVRGLFHRGDPK